MPPAWAFWGTCKRGAATAVYDYAHFGERLLGFERPLIICSNSMNGDDASLKLNLKRLRARFGANRVFMMKQRWFKGNARRLVPEVDAVLAAHNVTHLYIMKGGLRDGFLSRLPGVRNCVHAAFSATQPHGCAYARVGSSVPTARGVDVPVISHVVQRQESTGDDLRAALGIPRNATVFCRHGGTPTFNIPFVKAAVAQHAGDEPSAWFLFMNTARFVKEHPHVRFLPPETDDAAKSRFIRTCDAMLHARREGETFGLAVAEFSAHNRPVITSSAHDDRGRARHHLDSLGKRGLYYDSKESLLRLLRTFDRTAARTGDWRAYTQYAPEVVMQTFRRVFLEAPCLPASGVGQ